VAGQSARPIRDPWVGPVCRRRWVTATPIACGSTSAHGGAPPQTYDRLVVPMRQVTWVSGSFRAHLLAARLRSEGIDVQLRGAVDGPYRLTVGDMARVDVWVPEDQLDDASLVLLAGEVDATLAAPTEWAHAGEEHGRRAHWVSWVAITVLATAGVAPIAVWLVER